MSSTLPISSLNAREVFDSRGRPTVEVEVACANAPAARVIVPSGASTGRFEAVELRDGDPDRLGGLGVRCAVNHVRGEIARALIGLDAADQQAVDRRLIDLDGTENKSRLGANALLGASLGCAYAAAAARGISAAQHLNDIWRQLPAKNTSSPRAAMSLPLPMVNMISGGLHAGGNLDFQDFLMLPVGATSFNQALDWTVAVYRALGKRLASAGYEGVLVGDEGGYGPKLANNRDAAQFLVDAIADAKLRPGDDVAIGLDVASTHFYRDGRYHLAAGADQALSSRDMVDLLEEWVDHFPIISIEDGLAEDDWEGWKELTRRLGDKVQLIGDDLFTTNTARLQQGLDRHCANAVLIKLNQIGTLWETLETLRLALDHDYLPVISARSGETEDVTIADLAVATGAGQIKIGSVARSERLAKYNQLLRLEEQLGPSAPFAGGAVFGKFRRT